jgi:hypothetical protein
LVAVLGEWAPVNNVWPQFAFAPEDLGTTGGDAADPVAYLTPIMRRVREQLEGR